MMPNIFNERAFSEVITQLSWLDYRNELLREDYRFRDWFSNNTPRNIPAAAFAQTPASYDTALIGVACSNGAQGQSLVDEYRSLGAPVILEVCNNEIREWLVSRKKGQHSLVERVPFDGITRFFADRASVWKPQELFRAKNIGKFTWTQQQSLFAGLVPELEERIQDSLEPLLLKTLYETHSAYKNTTGREPDELDLFKLIFSLLTAKVFYDRRVNGFASLQADATSILKAINKKYGEDRTSLLNRATRDVAASHIWNILDFSNLSVEVLAQMWSTTLLDQATKKRLGIHRTSRTIVRYIVEKIQFHQSGDDNRIIFEPCAGSSAFLIGAMNQLRPQLFGMPPQERHKYFVKRFVGIEKDPFGVEISKLALTLADFPNVGGWKIIQDDVFRDGALTGYVRQAGVVLCNPPFRDFDKDERPNYRVQSFHKPVELMFRILNDLHPSGVLGFVLPRTALDGSGGYKQLRELLAQRFKSLDLTWLPDRAFPEADVETALLVATEPIPHNVTKLTFSKVNDSETDWKKFDFLHEVNNTFSSFVTPSEAEESLLIPDLPEVWDYFKSYQVLDDIVKIHRGLQWNEPLTEKGKETGNRSKFVKDAPAENFHLGVAPQTKLRVLEVPDFKFLSLDPKHQTGNSFNLAWEKPKVILNKSARGRGRWRITALPDSQGVTCYQTFIAVWSNSNEWDEIMLSAVINSPVANAFVASREGKTDVTLETIKKIPVPVFTDSQKRHLRNLVSRYQEAINPFFIRAPHEDPESLLKEIDALVLDGYKMPAKFEHQILTYFQGHNKDRRTGHDFSDYLSPEQESYFSLSTHLSLKFQRATAGAMLEYFEKPKV